MVFLSWQRTCSIMQAWRDLISWKSIATWHMLLFHKLWGLTNRYLDVREGCISQHAYQKYRGTCLEGQRPIKWNSVTTSTYCRILRHLWSRIIQAGSECNIRVGWHAQSEKTTMQHPEDGTSGQALRATLLEGWMRRAGAKPCWNSAFWECPRCRWEFWHEINWPLRRQHRPSPTSHSLNTRYCMAIA